MLLTNRSEHNTNFAKSLEIKTDRVLARITVYFTGNQKRCENDNACKDEKRGEKTGEGEIEGDQIIETTIPRQKFSRH
jgi:hypothetical protein